MSKRMNIELSERTKSLLGELSTELETTEVGAIRFGLAALALILREHRHGNVLAAMKDGKVVREIEPLWLSPAGVA